ncbi:MAG TPA: hypothetical protein VIY48_06915 [Candidatus Paceibacterota bacterium]
MNLHEYADSLAASYSLNAGHFKAVVSCESQWNASAVGDGGQSYGIAQFYHPEQDWGFTKEQALDPYFALDQMAKAWSEGKASKWSCWRILYG